ncbi:MAG TPA: sulfatase-like hydrolase/transferase [Chloroflexota bacterium]|nr:sulfatase-like hydrolase/transferase [Chloroflexota bacterium]
MNLVYIMSDQHNRAMMGASGHPTVRTPALDALAERGTRFTNAYTNCPICVPARASFATGRYVHHIGYWDNGMPYDGRVPSWGHRLVQQGHRVTTIGKLHYRSVEDDTGFPDQRIPMHVHGGKGDVHAMLRDPVEPVPGAINRLLNAGPGESAYTRYDRSIAESAVSWLAEESRGDDKPWVLFVSFVCPHPPLRAPQEFYDMYPIDKVELPKSYRLSERPMHPALQAQRHRAENEGELDEEVIRRAIATYYGLCSFLDSNVGQVLRAIEDAGLSDTTRIVYTSDHGEMLGHNGLWWKSTMYDASAAVPLIIAGPDVPAGAVVDTGVSLVDSFPTILEAVGATLTPEDAAELPGTSIWPIARGEQVPERIVFSEYHAAGSPTGTFMIRREHFKYVHYVGLPAQLFDLRTDPDEINDRASDPAYASVLRECEQELRKIIDPEAINAQAKAAQRVMIDAYGGIDAVRAAGPPFVEGTPTPDQFHDRDTEVARG